MQWKWLDENTWMYPDREPEDGGIDTIWLARGGHAGVQIWTEGIEERAVLELELPEGITGQWYQMIPVKVEENSDRSVLTTLDYESVRDFVTRQAPFMVYDRMKPIACPEDARLLPGRAVFFLRLEARSTVDAFTGEGAVRIRTDKGMLEKRITLRVTRAEVPALARSRWIVNNWLKYDDIAWQHKAEKGSDAYDAVMGRYMENLLEIRSNQLLLPSGVPIRDENGKVTGFDFSFCEHVGQMALAKGFASICGGFVARFKVWDEPEQYLLWENDTGVCSLEAYRQLKIYFTELWKVVQRNSWEKVWMQCLVDEPQFPNSMSYRALACICRKCMPGVTIHDPVESTEVEGAMDIWCIKQAVFEKYRDTYKQLQAMGERLTVYTCGFPAGKWMNRATDLPLLAGRLPFWMAAREEMEGFLHWGYNAYANEDPMEHNCFSAGERKLPPGNGFIVYPAEDGPEHTLRSQIQLFGAEDMELLNQLPLEKRTAICDQLCSSFENYVDDPKVFARVHQELMEAF